MWSCTSIIHTPLWRHFEGRRPSYLYLPFLEGTSESYQFVVCLTMLFAIRTARNMKATVNDKFEKKWKEVIATCFNILFHHFPVRTNKNHERYQGRESQGDLLNIATFALYIHK